MKENTGYIRAKTKTHEQVIKIYPPAECWGKEPDPVFGPPADEIILPYLGKTVWVKK